MLCYFFLKFHTFIKIKSLDRFGYSNIMVHQKNIYATTTSGKYPNIIIPGLLLS